MLNSEQQKWINHLSDDDQVIIKPLDPEAEEKFLEVKKIIHQNLGDDIKVEHHGATSLGISGQDEIDVYVPTPPDQFNHLLTQLENVFGKPRSHYDLERARFVTQVDGKHIDIFLINDTCDGWLNCLKFEDHLHQNHEALWQYRDLKESANGASTREYYRQKIEFINNILKQ